MGTRKNLNYKLCLCLTKKKIEGWFKGMFRISIFAAAEPSLRDNASLRQNGLLPAVRHTCIKYSQLSRIYNLSGANIFLDVIGPCLTKKKIEGWFKGMF